MTDHEQAGPDAIITNEHTDAAQPGFGRRALFQRGLVSAAGISVAGGLLAACGSVSSSTSSAAATGTATASSSNPSLTIAFPQSGGSGLTDLFPLIHGLEQAGKDLGVKTDVTVSATYSLVDQANLVETAILKKPDAIVTGIYERSSMRTPMAHAKAAGIPVYVVNGGEDDWELLGAICYSGLLNKPSAVQAADRFNTMGATNVLILNPSQEIQSLNDRATAFAAAFHGKSTQVITGIPNPTTSKNIIKAALQRGKYDGILSLSADVACAPALEAVNELGLKGIKIGTFDLPNAKIVVDGVKSGQVAFAMDRQQYLMGYYAVLGCTQYVQHHLLPGGGMAQLTGPVFVTSKDTAVLNSTDGTR